MTWTLLIPPTLLTTHTLAMFLPSLLSFFSLNKLSFILLAASGVSTSCRLFLHSFLRQCLNYWVSNLNLCWHALAYDNGVWDYSSPLPGDFWSSKTCHKGTLEGDWRSKGERARGMAQQLRAHAVLVVGLGSVPRIYSHSQPSVSSVQPHALFWPSWALCTHHECT